MTNLSHTARVVINDGKDVFDPSHADRVRVTELLTQRIGAMALGVGSAPIATSSLVSAHSFTSWRKVVGTVGLVAIGGALYLANGNTRALPPPSNAVAPRPAVVVEPPPAPETPAAPEAVPSVASVRAVPAERIARPGRARIDTLGEEVSLLTLAGKELHSGRPASALKALDEHQSRFPAGALAQERSAVRVRALCALGRTSQAAAEAAKLARNAPQMTRAEHPCDAP